MPEKIYPPGSAISHDEDVRSATSTGEAARSRSALASVQTAVQQ